MEILPLEFLWDVALVITVSKQYQHHHNPKRCLQNLHTYFNYSTFLQQKFTRNTILCVNRRASLDGGRCDPVTASQSPACCRKLAGFGRGL
jgi:hypothetical protein